MNYDHGWYSRLSEEEKEQEVEIIKWRYPDLTLPALLAYRRLMWKEIHYQREMAAASKVYRDVEADTPVDPTPLFCRVDLLLDPPYECLLPLSMYQRYVLCMVAELGITETAGRLGEPASTIDRVMHSIRRCTWHLHPKTSAA